MRAKKAGFKIVATVKSRTGNVLSKTMWGQNAQLQTRSKTWAKNRTNKLEKIRDAKPKIIIQRQLWLSIDLKTTLQISINELSYFSHCWSKCCCQVSIQVFYSFPNVVSDFLLLNNNVAASTLPYWSCFSTGSCPLVWGEKSNWSKMLPFLMFWIGWYKLLSNFFDWLIPGPDG